MRYPNTYNFTWYVNLTVILLWPMTHPHFCRGFWLNLPYQDSFTMADRATKSADHTLIIKVRWALFLTYFQITILLWYKVPSHNIVKSWFWFRYWFRFRTYLVSVPTRWTQVPHFSQFNLISFKNLSVLFDFFRILLCYGPENNSDRVHLNRKLSK